MKETHVKKLNLTKQIVFWLLIYFVLFQPVSVIADEIKSIPNKVGNQISSDARSEAVTVVTDVSDAFVELNCENDPTSQECAQTKSVNVIWNGFVFILKILGVIGVTLFVVGIIMRF